MGSFRSIYQSVVHSYCTITALCVVFVLHQDLPVLPVLRETEVFQEHLATSDNL